MDKLKPYLRILPEVQKALAAGLPVVALDSDSVLNGKPLPQKKQGVFYPMTGQSPDPEGSALPYPQNAAAAGQILAAVRENGAVPALLAVCDGLLCIGLTDAETDALAKTADTRPAAGRRELPALLVQKGSARATPGAAMIMAALAGIEVMVTLPIGGDLHPATQPDKNELTRTSLLVVCNSPAPAFAPAATMSFLTASGVPVVGYRTDAFPSQADTPADIAAMYAAHQALGLQGTLLAVNPVPIDVPPADALRLNAALAAHIAREWKKNP